MSKGKVRNNVWVDQNKNYPNLIKDQISRKPNQHGSLLSHKHLKKVYPLGIQKSSSSLSLSSLSLSQNSTDSSLRGSIILGDWKIPVHRREVVSPRNEPKKPFRVSGSSITSLRPLYLKQFTSGSDGSLNRCPWITKTTDEIYVNYHDKCWGVPVYDDFQLFELLALSGMLMYHFWIDILKRRESYREAFASFDPNVVANMGEKDIKEISSNKSLMLDESLVRCIVDNARSILKVTMEYGSFSNYLWGYMNYQPLVNQYRHQKNVPIRSPKAEIISRDLIRRGFRFVGPVIIHSFMQAAGMTIDHLIDCFKFTECVSLVENTPHTQN